MKNANFDPTVHNNNLPKLPPPCEVETKAVLKACLAATRALAELKGSVRMLPDQSILINSIPLQEAKLSSEIENIVTTQDKLFEANLLQESSRFSGDAVDESKIDPATKEVLNYRAALHYGFEAMKERSFSMRLIRDVCSVLRKKTVQFRGYGDNVALKNPSTGEIKYTPPEGGDVLLDKLSDLEDYCLNYTRHDSLIKMALMHYQFESIHPFDDGNGRAGRIMNILYLIHEKLLDLPILYLSRFIIETKSEYYKLLRSVTENGSWEAWVLYMLKGIAETAALTTTRVNEISDFFAKTRDEVRERLPNVYSKELVELIFKQAYCRVDFLIRENIAKRQTAARYLKALVDIGVLEEIKRGRDKIYVNLGLTDILRR